LVIFRSPKKFDPIYYAEVLALVVKSISELPKTAKVLWRTKLLSLWIIERLSLRQAVRRHSGYCRCRKALEDNVVGAGFLKTR
jgi:hypothetical protein